jgi:uncharacterized membrane protein
MDLQSADEKEWGNQDNWAGVAGCRCYFSKKDRRLWVPKSNPHLGWTVNLGHKYGFMTLIAIVFLPLFIVILAIVIVTNSLTGRGHGF